MFIHYIAIATVFRMLEFYGILALSSTTLFITLMIITFIFMIITLYKYLKDKKGGNYGNNT